MKSTKTKPRMLKPDDEPSLDEDTYYGHSFFCSNCGTHQDRWILKGVKVKDVNPKCV